MYSKNLVFAAACLGMLLFGIVFLSLGSMNNMLAERFKLDDRAIGTLTALLPAGILLGSLVFGPVVDRFGYRWMLVGASLVVGGALEGMVLTESKTMVQFCVFAIGFGGGILNGATNALAADVSEGERGAKLSLLGVFFGIGALTMPSARAALADHFSQTAIVAGVGTLSILPALYCLSIAFPHPKLGAERVAIRRALALLGDTFLLLTCLALALQSGMEGLSNDWMTRYFKNAVLTSGADERGAQLSLVALTGAMMVARLAIAGVLRHVGARIVLLVSLCAIAAGAIFLASAPTGDSYWPLIGPMLIGAGLAAIFPIVLGFVGDRYPQQSGTAFSVIFFIALACYMAINKTFGYIAQEYGVQQYPKVLLALLVVAATLLHFVNNLREPQAVNDPS